MERENHHHHHHRSNDLESKIFFSKYQADKKVGEGSFGKIYSAHNINTGQKFALKLEDKNSGQSLLEQESYVLCYLKGEGIPFVKSYGYSGEYNVLVMELLGKSLEDLFQENHCKFSVKTVCMLGIQMITRLEWIHTKHILHRDIKPDNFVMGLGDKSHIVYLLDFGLSKKYRSARTLQHIRYSENRKLTGTARYASVHALKGCEQGRRDDVEAVGYVLLYFLRGSLPWQGLRVNRGEDKYQKIYEKKRRTTPSELCNGFPNEFCQFVEYTRGLNFEEEPDYNYLKKLLEKVMTDNNYNMDYIYDWTKYDEKEVKKITNVSHNRNNSTTNNFEEVDNKNHMNDENIHIGNSNVDSNIKNNGDNKINPDGQKKDDEDVPDCLIF